MTLSFAVFEVVIRIKSSRSISW